VVPGTSKYPIVKSKYYEAEKAGLRAKNMVD